METLMIWMHVLAALLFSALLSVSMGWLLLRWIFGRPLCVRADLLARFAGAATTRVARETKILNENEFAKER